MATFVLVHGAWHGGWCWGVVPQRLESAGHHAICVNLPCDDSAAGWIEYREITLGQINGVDDELILVGHSLGGCVVPLVAEQREVSRVVLVCSFPPLPGESLDDAAIRDAIDEAGYEVVG